MSYTDLTWAGHERKRWLRPDWQRWVRHDAHLFAPPDPNAYRSYASRLIERQREEEEQAATEAERKAFEADLLELRRQLAKIKFELAWRRICRKYREDQPRVPKGDPKGGQWAKEGGGDAGKDGGRDPQVMSDATPDDEWKPGAQYAARRGEPRRPVKLPASVTEWLTFGALTPDDRLLFANRQADDAISKVRQIERDWEPRPSAYDDNTESRIQKAKDLVLEAEGRLVELGYRSPNQLIQTYRAQNNSLDLFGRPTWGLNDGVVGVTIMDRLPIFGVNSGAPTYEEVDGRTADAGRDVLLESHPDIMKRENIGQKPNDAVYHAEATVLFRAARANGGTLAGRSLDVYVDDVTCPSCEKVLPILGLELGNPTVTFVDAITGAKRTMANGGWVRSGRQ